MRLTSQLVDSSQRLLAHGPFSRTAQTIERLTREQIVQQHVETGNDEQSQQRRQRQAGKDDNAQRLEEFRAFADAQG